MKLINKDALVAEIDSWRDGIKKGIFSIPLTGSDRAYATFEYEILGKVKDLLDTLEVKEVDLDKEYEEFVENDAVYRKLVNSIVGKRIAKHFFELGLKAQ